MSELKATPGPWLKVKGTAFIYALDENGTNIFQTHVEGAHCPAFELEANAHLVAAAPELYGALKALEAMTDNGNGSLHPVRKTARAALAKARGES